MVMLSTEPICSPSQTTDQKLTSGVQEAHEVIKTILDASKEAKETFKCQWDNILEIYEQDLVVLNDALEKLPPSLNLLTQMKEKERLERKKKSKKKGSITTTNDHALNFHLKCMDSNSDDIFILPPPTNTKIDKNDKHIIDEASISVSIPTKKINSQVNRLSKEQKRRRIQKVKIYAREKMFEKMQEMRECEIQIEQRLSGTFDEDQEPREREELEYALEKCRKHNGEVAAQLISQYKPYSQSKNTGVLNSNPGLGTNLMFKRLDIASPSIERLLRENKNGEVVDGYMACFPYNQRNNVKEKRLTSEETYDIGSYLAKEDKRSFESIVKEDPDQVLPLENLPVRSGISNFQSLKELVIENTRKLDDKDIANNEASISNDGGSNSNESYSYDDEFEDYGSDEFEFEPLVP
jgi:hypothetical protein